MEKAIEKIEKEGYEVKVVKTEKSLRAQVTKVCRSYYLQVWNEALN